MDDINFPDQNDWKRLLSNDWESNSAVIKNPRVSLSPPSPLQPFQQPGQNFKFLPSNPNLATGLLAKGLEIIPDGKLLTMVRGFIAYLNPQKSVNLPRPVIMGNKKPTILEFLRVEFFNQHDVTVNSNIFGFLSTAPVVGNFEDFLGGTVIAGFIRNSHEDTEGAIVDVWPKVIDLTDGAGHGVLVATDKIFLTVTSGATGSINSVIARIMYRYKSVKIEEYVGIVQSQQN